MIKITGVTVDGFRNLDDIHLSLKQITALISLNNYGKSNVLEAIDFGNDFIQASAKSKFALMGRPEVVPINNQTASRNFYYEITFLTHWRKKLYNVSYRFAFEWIKNQAEQGQRIVEEVLQMKPEEKGGKFSTYIQRDAHAGYYRPSEKSRCDKHIKISTSELLVNKLANFDDLFFLQVIEAINDMDMLFLSLTHIERYFNVGFYGVVGAESQQVEYQEAPNISKFIYQLKTNEPDTYEMLAHSIIELLPDIEYITPVQTDLKSLSNPAPEGIPYQLPENIYDLRVKTIYNNQEISIKNMSLGTKRIIHILTSAIEAERTGTRLIAYEEPENSIHPALLQKLLILIDGLAEHVQFLITSHSPYLISYLDIGDIYLGLPKKDGLARFKQLKKNKEKQIFRYAKEADMSLGEFVFDMLLEGFDEESYWNEFI